MRHDPQIDKTPWLLDATKNIQKNVKIWPLASYDALVACWCTGGQKIISKVYLDRPTGKPHNFQKNPPELRGQIGVPPIVDKLLGK